MEKLVPGAAAGMEFGGTELAGMSISAPPSRRIPKPGTCRGSSIPTPRRFTWMEGVAVRPSLAVQGMDGARQDGCCYALSCIVIDHS